MGKAKNRMGCMTLAPLMMGKEDDTQETRQRSAATQSVLHRSG